MRQTTLMTAALSMALLTAMPARADFQIGHAEAEPLIVLGRPGDAAPPVRPGRLPRAAAVAPRFRTARGFGQAVPLRFAARQIVPATVSVRYGPGADPDAGVDWTGDAPWNRVLAAAVKPLGLRLTIGAQTVLISR